MALKIRLMLVDDHEVVRLGLKALFKQTETIEVIAEAANVADAVRNAALDKPDLVLMDLSYRTVPASMRVETFFPPIPARACSF